MSVITLRMPDDKHERLRRIAQARGISVNRLLDEMATIVLTQHDAEAHFRALAAQGARARGLAILDKLNQHYAGKPRRRK